MTRLSATGAAVASVAGVASVGAWRLGWSELWAIATAGGVALALAWLSTLAVPPLVARRIDPVSRTTVGAEVPVRLLVANRGRRARRSRTALDRIGPDVIEVTLPAVRAGAEEVVDYAAPARRRGHHPWGPIVVSRADGLGLFEAAGEIAPAGTLIVHPRNHRLSLDPAGRRRDLDGLRTDLAEGSITFHALREYVPGDDLRRVHWRSTARTGTMVVRQDVDPSEPRTVIAVDGDAEHWDGDALEHGLEVAASLTVAAAGAGFPLALAQSEGSVVDGGVDGVAVLDALAAFVSEPGAPLVVPVAESAVDAAGLVVVVTGAVAVARAAADRARAAADRAVLVAVVPGTAASIEPAGAGATLLVAGTAEEVIALWAGTAA